MDGTAIYIWPNNYNTNPTLLAQERKRYKIDIEIYETREDSWCHKKGDTFEYPAEMGKLCPWLLSSMHDFIRLMLNDVTLTWKYEGTPYEKVLNENGITTEYVRCPDPQVIW